VSLVVGGFLLAEAGAWAFERIAGLDRPLGPGLYVLAGSGGQLLSAGDGAGSLGATRDLRVSMVVMSLGMAYMVLAMAT
jgi:hypothetical protein